MEKDLDANYPDLDISILGMNPIRLEVGNEAVSEGRDIPWLQDIDADEDGQSDNWLTSWPFVYRDVVVVDANNVAVDSFNLTLHSLEEPDSYDALRQMLIDVAVSAIDATDDLVSTQSGTTTDINVLGNDEGLSRLEIDSVSTPQHGIAEIVTIQVPADLDSIEPIIPELIISEIVPGEYIELYNSAYAEINLSSADQYLVSGLHHVGVADLGSGQTIPARGYRQLAWPSEMSMSWESGELVLFRDNTSGFDDLTKIEDFVAWGESPTDSRIEMATKARKWYGPPDGTLDLGAIQRIPGTLGDEVHSYDNHRPSTPGEAINSAVATQQVVRFIPADSFAGEDRFTYTVVDDKGVSDVAEVTVSVSSNARPWRNPRDRFDVNNDREVSESDALSILGFLNAGYSGQLPMEVRGPLLPAPFVDCDGSNSVEPLDALLVFNYLNGDQAAAEAEPDLSPSLAVNSIARAAIPRDTLQAEVEEVEHDQPAPSVTPIRRATDLSDLARVAGSEDERQRSQNTATNTRSLLDAESIDALFELL